METIFMFNIFQFIILCSILIHHSFTCNIMNIEIGTPPQPMRIKLSSRFCGLAVLKHESFGRGFQLTKSSSAHHMKSNMHLKHYNGLIIKDIISFGNFYNINTPIFLIIHPNTIEPNIEGVLGLGRNCINSNMQNINEHEYILDIFSLLINNNNNNNHNESLLFKKKRVFYLSHQGNSALISLCEYPKSLSSLKPFQYKTIPLLVNAVNVYSYNVVLNALVFDTKELIPIDQVISIDLYGTYFVVYEKLFKYIIKKYFMLDEFVIVDECKLIEVNEIEQLICDKYVNVFEYIMLLFGKFSLKIYIKDLFMKMEINGQIKEVFVIVMKKQKYLYNNENEMCISQWLFKNKTFVYDNEKNIIGILNNNNKGSY